MTPRVVVAPPPDWRQADVARPKIAESAGAELVGWSALAAPSGSPVLVSGCVATPIPGWVEDMRPAIEARTVALAGAVGERITGLPMDARSDGAGRFVLRPASALDGPWIGAAHTFVGFDENPRVFTCFATCTARRPGEALAPCPALVAEARLDDAAGPPAPGLALESVTWAVHHPRPAAFGGGLLVVAASVLAILTRRRPRFRAQSK